MKKFFSLLLVLVLAFSLVACGTKEEEETVDDGTPKIGDEGKIAVVRNMSASDHTTQFLAGCVAEGNALGYEVDTYISEGDDAKMQDLWDQCINKNYDILIISHANEGYQASYSQASIDSGKVVVGFDCNGDHVDGVTYTSQGDITMTTKALTAITEKLKECGGTEPYPLLEYNKIGSIIPFDLRHEENENWANAGKIDHRLANADFTDGYTCVYNHVTKMMIDYPDTPVGIFLCACGGSTTLGVQDAINDAGRTDDVWFAGIDISNEVIEYIQSLNNFLGVGCCDPYVVGVIDVRIGVSKIHGDETPEEFACTNVFVGKDDVNSESNMLNMSLEGFGDTEDFRTDYVEELRAKYKDAQG